MRGVIVPESDVLETMGCVRGLIWSRVLWRRLVKSESLAELAC